MSYVISGCCLGHVVSVLLLVVFHLLVGTNFSYCRFFRFMFVFNLSPREGLAVSGYICFVDSMLLRRLFRRMGGFFAVVRVF